jgi:hypothetical protein
MKCRLAYICVSYLLQIDAITPWKSAVYLLMSSVRCGIVQVDIFFKIKGMNGDVVSRVMEGATVSYQSFSGNVSDTTLLVKALDNLAFVKASSFMEYIFIRTNN